MKNFCLSVVAIAVSISSFAQNVPFETAEKVASNFLMHKTKGNQKSNSLLLKNSFTETKNGNTLYHIFNFENTGFVIVAGNYQSTPILGYSNENELNIENLNPALKMWLESYTDNFQNNNSQVAYSEPINKAWDNMLNNIFNIQKDNSIVEPLTTSKWNQDCYYNAYCPEDLDVTGEIGGSYDNHVPNGCVSVAMAQVMYYHRYPNSGTSSFSYVSPYGRLTANFANANYDYNAMSDVATGYSDALALLISHCGISVEMDYGADGSGSQTDKARTSLVGYFNYSSSSKYEKRETYNDTLWLEKIVQNLDNRLPIIYSGRKANADAGHCWVCDGYDLTEDTVMLHFNWGWGPSGGNGWYSLPAVGGFTIGEAAIFGLTPKVTLPDCAHDTLTATYGSFYSGPPTRDYPNNADCSWLISSPNATSIQLSVSSFSTEIANDIVTIYTGNSTSSAIAYTISGDTITPGTVFNINSSEALITFTSNESITKQGFVFTYKTTLSNLNYCLTSIDPGTVNTLTSASGTLTNGSGNNNYANNNACYWRIEPTGAKGVWINVTDFNLARGDELSIYAHSKKYVQAVKFTNRIAKYTVDNPPTDNILVSDSAKIYIMFRTDNNLNNKGWSLKWGIDVGIQEKNSGISSLNVYPNPANEILTIDILKEPTVHSVNAVLRDISGRTLNCFEINQDSYKMDISNYAKGIYILTLTTNIGSINQKIIVE